jgi:hypothetical protein
MKNIEKPICTICGQIIQDHIPTEYLLNGNHLSCEIEIFYKTI